MPFVAELGLLPSVSVLVCQGTIQSRPPDLVTLVCTHNEKTSSLAASSRYCFYPCLERNLCSRHVGEETTLVPLINAWEFHGSRFGDLD